MRVRATRRGQRNPGDQRARQHVGAYPDGRSLDADLATGPSSGFSRGLATGLATLGVAALSLGLIAAPSAWAQAPQAQPGLSPAAASARTLLNGPRLAPPVTEHAGMGTADPPAAPSRALPATGGIDSAGSGEMRAAPPVAPAPLAPASLGPAPAAAPRSPAPVTASSSAPARGGVDAAGSDAPAPASSVATQPPQAAKAAQLPSPAKAAQPSPQAAEAARSSSFPEAVKPPSSADVAKPAPAAVAAPAVPVQPAGPGTMSPAPQLAAPAVGGAPAVAGAAPVPAVTGPLAPVAEAVLAAVTQPEALGSTKRDGEALKAFYEARAGLPLFMDEYGVAVRGTAVGARLAAAGEDGLDPDDYAVAVPARGADAPALAQAELRLAAAALTYARHAQSGRFPPSRISALVTPTREIPDPAEVLATLAAAADANAALAAYNPPHAGYKALKAKLAEMARPRAPDQVLIPGGDLLKPGASDPRVPLLRARLGVPAVAGDLSYDPALVSAVKVFQTSAGLKPSGVVGAGTLTALNRTLHGVSPAQRSDVIANMERWRWLPRDLGAAYVWVNIPEYKARIIQAGEVVFATRIVVGKPQTPTPLLSEDMRYAVVNPAWNIPASIARNEMMPLLRNNPDALSRRGIQVVRDGSGGYSFRQAPGSKNALGRIKFMFPNDHAVYLHDTPSRSLFAQDKRAFSHGCMRVQDPMEFGEVLFSIGLPGERWSTARLDKMVGSKERYITLKQRVPVHVVYFTAVVGPDGRLESFDDLYGINAEVKVKLGLEGKRRLADRATTR